MGVATLEGTGVNRLIITLLSVLLAIATVRGSETSPEILVVIGASGGDEYADAFGTAGTVWQQAAVDADVSLRTIGIGDNDSADHEQIKAWLESRSGSSSRPIWLVMIGHGTFAKDVAKFNLRGPDVSAAELATWLNKIKRPIVVINGASASGPFINQLSGQGRIIVTATKSGSEQNYARFGNFFARSIASMTSDLDHDDEVSIQEAFVKAAAEVERFYESKDRIATEHALIDDNGDGFGTPASMFRGLRAVKNPKDDKAMDGNVAGRMTWSPSGSSLSWTSEQLQRRQSIEQDIDALRSEKSAMNPDLYYKQLEPLMLDLASLYRDVESQKVDLSLPTGLGETTIDGDASNDDPE